MIEIKLILEGEWKREILKDDAFILCGSLSMYNFLDILEVWLSFDSH